MLSKQIFVNPASDPSDRLVTPIRHTPLLLDAVTLRCTIFVYSGRTEYEKDAFFLSEPLVS